MYICEVFEVLFGNLTVFGKMKCDDRESRGERVGKTRYYIEDSLNYRWTRQTRATRKTSSQSMSIRQQLQYACKWNRGEIVGKPEKLAMDAQWLVWGVLEQPRVRVPSHMSVDSATPGVNR